MLICSDWFFLLLTNTDPSLAGNNQGGKHLIASCLDTVLKVSHRRALPMLLAFYNFLFIQGHRQLVAQITERVAVEPEEVQTGHVDALAAS